MKLLRHDFFRHTIFLTLSSIGHRLMPESLTWLLSTDRLEKAEEVIKKACKFNGVDEPKKMFIMERENPNFEMPAMDTDRHETGSVLDLFRFPKMRKYTLIMFFEW